jgi:hypothetical protein
MEDARRQGFANKDTYKMSSKEMLYKQAFKRCADRVGYDVLMGLGTSVPVDYEVEVAKKTSGSAAEVIEEAAGEIVVEDVTLEQLADKINAVWGAGKKVAGRKKLEICGMVMKEMGTPREFKKLEELGPFEVKSIYDYLTEKYPDNTLRVAEPEEEKSSAAPVDDDEAPPAMEAEEDDEDKVPEPDEEVEEADDSHLKKAETLLYLASSARKQHKGRSFVKETRPGVFFFIDMAVLKDAGLTESQMVQKDGEQKIDGEACKRLCMELVHMPGVALPGAEPLARHANRT